MYYRQNKIIYWVTARHYPRLVHPNGMVERDLTLSLASDNYHVTNIKDLLMLYQLEPLTWLEQYIIKGTFFLRNYVQDLGIESAVKRSSYYIEFIDILYLYDKIIEPIAAEEITALKDDLYRVIQGYSLDFDALDLTDMKRRESGNNFR